MLLLLLMSSWVSSAQPSDPVHLPPVVITSKGEQEDYLEVPARVDRVQKQELAHEKVRFVGEALNRVPGVITREMNPLIPAIGIRTPANTNSPYWLATHDSIPIVSSVNYSHESPTRMFFGSGAGDLEVLKGTSSVIYGSDAISAVVNLNSPDPTATPEAKLGIEGGERGFIRLKGSSSRWWNEHDGYALTGNLAQDKGWRENQSSKRGEMIGREVHKLESGGSWTTTLLANSRYSTEAGYLTKAAYDENPTLSGNLAGIDYYRRNTYVRLASEYKKEAGGRGLSLTPYVRFDDYRLLEYWNSTLPTSISVAKTLGFRGIQRWSTETSHTDAGLDLEATDFSRMREQTQATVLGGGGDTTKDVARGIQQDYDVGYYSFSPFVNYSYLGVPKWRFDAGMRGNYSIYDYRNRAKDGTCESANNQDGNCGIYYRPPSRKDHFQNVSPKAGLSYEINRESAVYANAGYGFKIPAAATLYEIRVTERSNDRLKPERSFSYEAGYKYDVERFGADFSAYQIDIMDRIVKTQGVAGELSEAVNAGRSRYQGLELGTRFMVLHGLNLLFSGSLAKNKFVDYKSGGVNYSGKTESQSPSQVFNTRLQWEPCAGFWTELEWRKTNGYWVEDANTNFESGYDLYNFRSEYRVKQWTASLRVMNLFDRRYAADVANFGSLRYRPAMPRTFYGGLEYAF